MNNFSYADIIIDRQKFRRAGTKGGGDFNFFDNPTSKFFKIFFYFENGDADGYTGLEDSSGLLSPTWLIDKKILDTNAYMYNSAYTYLMLNDEVQRALLLKKFVELLSNISSESPWYFNSIEGLDAALERKVATERDFKFEEQRQKISIKCLPDSYDDRIGTLLDLYRSIVWSWAHKREVLPANLRKFDMGILIFNDPTIPFHHYTDNGEKYADISVNSNYRPSYKYIELHNCEIDYNSSKAGVTGLNNSTGIIPEYTIDIFFDDLYEYRYNEFSMRSMGDMLTIDHLLYSAFNKLPDEVLDSPYIDKQFDIQNDLLAKLINYFETSDLDPSIGETVVNSVSDKLNDLTKKKLGDVKDKLSSEAMSEIDLTKKKLGSAKDKFLGEVRNNDFVQRAKNLSLSKSLKNATNQLIGTATNMIEGVVERAVLGNLYTFSLSRLADQALSLAEGNIWTAGRNISEYVRDAKQRKQGGVQTMDDISNLNESQEESTSQKTKYINHSLGNMFQSSTIANNI